MSPLTTAVTGGESPSPPSTPTTSSGTQSTRSKPKPKLIRKNTRAKTKHRVNKLTLSDHAKHALKRATPWYAREKNIPGGGGLPLYQIAKKVKREYDGVGPHPATIRKYVNVNITGMSPLKHGVKGDVPACAFKSISIVFESYVRIQQINSRQCW